jgi:ABC-type multidrug transport system ATPase subunit
VALVCDHLLLLDRGRVRYEGATAGLLDSTTRLVVRPVDPNLVGALTVLVRDVIGTVPHLDAGRDLHPTGEVHVAGDEHVAARVIEAAVTAGIGIAEARLERADLEEVFLRLTAAESDVGAKRMATVDSGQKVDR